MAAETTNRYLATLERLLAVRATAVKPALNEASDLLAAALNADKVDAFVYEEASHTLVALGTSDTAMARQEIALGLDRLPIANGGRAAQVFQTGKSFQHARLETDDEELLGIREGLKVRSVLAVPLIVDDVRRGVLQVDSARPDAFTEEDARFLNAVAGWVGLVMHRSELVEQLTQEVRKHARQIAAEEIVTALAHDLRNYLAPMMTRVQTLRLRAERDGHASYAAEADGLVQRLNQLSELLTDLLDVTRLERGLFTPDRRPTELGSLLREATQAMASSTLAFQIRTDEAIVADVDPRRLRQAVDNLLSNAERYAPGSEVTVELLRVSDGDGDTAVISIADRGPGIPPDMLPRITDAFVRGRKGRGLGIGLYLVRGIVEAHGGKFVVESTLGVGSTFRLELPLESAR